MGFSRYQRGTVYKCGKRIKVWYGRWREDVRLPDGGFSRCQRNERLGTMMELPTRSSAYEELSRRMSRVVSAADGLKFSALVERWKAAVLPTIKETTAKQYESELRSQLVPVFGERIVSSIGRYDVEMFLADKAKSYCRNTLRGMRVSLSVVLSWAVACGWLDKNPCAGVRLPNAGKRIVRTILQLEDVLAIADKLQEPYATLVLFLAVTGLRVGEAIAVKWEDFDGDVLQISRRIYQGKIDTPKSEKSKRSLPIPKELLARIKSLGSGEWIFRANNGSPVNPGNALKRYIRPAVKEVGLSIGGWHDFRHTLVTRLRKQSWSPKVIADIVGHSSARITEAVYDHSDREDFRIALGGIAEELFRNVPKSATVN